jgi:hypothetical protein
MDLVTMIGRGGGSSVTLSQEAKLYHCAPHWKREMPHWLVYLFFFIHCRLTHWPFKLLHCICEEQRFAPSARTRIHPVESSDT